MGEGVSLTKGVSHIGEQKPPENILKPSVAEAVKAMPDLPVRKNGVFHHPSSWTPEEDEAIAQGLRGMVPLHIIAAKVHCERHSLSRHIEDTPELRQLKIDCMEARIDNAEYQADRLVTAGNPTMIMFTLERQGRRRGWGQQEETVGQKEESRIVMGLIPEEEVKVAENAIAGLQPDGTIPESAVDAALSAATDPLEAAIAAQAAVDSVLGRTDVAEAAQPVAPAEVSASQVSKPPYDDETYGESMPQSFDDGGYDDPEMAFDDGGNSPFNL